MGAQTHLWRFAGVLGGAEGVEVERDHARRVGAIDERVDPPRGECRDDPLDRQDERGRARDVAENGESRPVRRRREDALDDVVLGRAGNGSRATTTRAPSRAAT